MNIVREQAMPTEVVVDTGADTPAGLSDRDRQIIAFERQWWKYAGSAVRGRRLRRPTSTTTPVREGSRTGVVVPRLAR